jgi:hypothetical protein
VGDTHKLEALSPVSGGEGIRYVWTSWSDGGTQTHFYVVPSSVETVTANYKTQYQVTFSQTGLDTTATGTVVTVGGTPKTITDLPYSDWFDSGTTYSYSTPVTSSFSGTRFRLTEVTGPAAPIGASGTVIGNYVTQYLLTVLTDPLGLNPQPTRNPAGEAGSADSWWYDADTSVTLTAQPVNKYVFSYWIIDTVSQASGLNPISVTMDAAHAATARYAFSAPGFQKRDVAVIKVQLSKTVVGESYSMNIYVTVKNQGDLTETFAVTLYANDAEISVQTVNLEKGESKTLTFIWYTQDWSKGSYNIKAVAETVPGEKSIKDNQLVAGAVLISTPGDLDGNKIVDLKDLSLMYSAIKRAARGQKYDANADINNDGKCDEHDREILTNNMGQSW